MSSLKQTVVIIVLATSWLPASCGSRSISAEITELFDDSHSPTVDLSRVGPIAWERVCVLGPYSTNDVAAEVLGFTWDAEGNSSIATNDAINLLVFVRGQEVLAFAEHRRDKGDFLELPTRCLARSRAVLVRRERPGGRVQLLPHDD